MSKDSLIITLLIAVIKLSMTLDVYAQQTYVFSGKGQWAQSEFWADAKIPPATLSKGDSVIINGECMFSSANAIHAPKGSLVLVNKDKRLYISVANNFKSDSGTFVNNGTLDILGGTFIGKVGGKGTVNVKPMAKMVDPPRPKEQPKKEALTPERAFTPSIKSP